MWGSNDVWGRLGDQERGLVAGCGLNTASKCVLTRVGDLKEKKKKHSTTPPTRGSSLKKVTGGGKEAAPTNREVVLRAGTCQISLRVRL